VWCVAASLRRTINVEFSNSTRAPSDYFQVFCIVVVWDYASVELWSLVDPLSVRRGRLVDVWMKVEDRITRGWICPNVILYVQSLHSLPCDRIRGWLHLLMLQWGGGGVGCNAIPLGKRFVLLGTLLAQSRTCLATDWMTGMSFTAHKYIRQRLEADRGPACSEVCGYNRCEYCF
jgi:hypothetical protein